MKIYHISEKQLAGMKEQIDKLHDAVTALNEAAGSIARELKFLAEDIERCPDGADN